MARHKHHASLEPSEPSLDISSLIDVCFLLLIYFLVTSTIAPQERDLGMSLSGTFPSDPDQPNIEPLFIDIARSGEIHTGILEARLPMDADPASRELPLLRGQLETYAGAARASNSTPLVQISADDQTTQQRVIDVLNTLAAVKIRSVTFSDPAGTQPLD